MRTNITNLTHKYTLEGKYSDFISKLIHKYFYELLDPMITDSNYAQMVSLEFEDQESVEFIMTMSKLSNSIFTLNLVIVTDNMDQYETTESMDTTLEVTLLFDHMRIPSDMTTVKSVVRALKLDPYIKWDDENNIGFIIVKRFMEVLKDEW